MITKDQRIEAMKGVLASLFASQRTLKSLAEGKKVQVKANFAASQIGFRGEADMLLCLKIDLSGDWTEIYYGDFNLVKNVARYSARDNKHMVPIAALQKIAKAGYVVSGPLPTASEADETDEPI